jgi:RNA polymerase sigma factor (sigma-70 family)
VDEAERLADRFEEYRGHLRAVAYRMLGSLAEADDAVQEAWLRFHRSDVTAVDNLGGWLTTVVGRVSLDMLRTRAARREDALDGAAVRLPDPVVSRPDSTDPERAALLADSVGLALLVVLDTLAPAERLAFVLHDMFSIPFEDIAPIAGRSEAATRQLASRARRRVAGAAPVPDASLARQREVLDAFLAASHDGDFEALVAVLDPDVVLRADYGGPAPAGVSTLLRGARKVAGQAMAFRQAPAHSREFVVVNGTPGVLNTAGGRPVVLLTFTITAGRIAAIDILADPTRLATLTP